MSGRRVISQASRRAMNLIKQSPVWKAISRSPFSHSIVRDETSFNALESEWEDLRVAFNAIPASRWNTHAKTPMQRHCWAYACLDTINADDDVQLVTYGTALAPLVRKRSDPHRLRFIGDRIREPYDVLSDDDTTDGLAEGMVKTGLPIKLARIPADAAIIGALQRAYRGRGFVKIKPRRNGCPYIDLNDACHEPERHFSAALRSNFRRGRRKAENIGDLTFEFIIPEVTQVGPLVEEAFAVEAAGWKRAAGTAMAVSPWRSAFYKRFAEHAAREGILRLCFLRIGGKTAAMEYVAECSGRFFTLKIGFDETFKVCSPGNLLRLETIRHAAQRGLSSYEFLGNDAPWTYFWTKSVHPMVSLEAYPATAYRGAGSKW